MNVVSLFAGIGGFELGLERAGMTVVAQCEIDQTCREHLAHHWPGVPQYDDVRTISASRLRADGVSCDVICGGFPCQDISEANTGGAGLDGAKSGLWFEFDRLIGEVRPRYVIVENTSALLGRGLGRVLGCLAARGYDAEWDSLPASILGAPHERDRVWIIAYPAKTHRGPILGQRHLARQHRLLADRSQDAGGATELPEASWNRPWREVADLVGRMDDGLPATFHGYNGFANAIVPQIAELIGLAILEADSAAETLAA